MQTLIFVFSIWGRQCSGQFRIGGFNRAHNRDVRNGVHHILSLTFVPVDDVPEVFDEFYDILPENLLEIADYFDASYLRGRRGRGRRRVVAPRYAPSLWNQYQAEIKNEQPNRRLAQ